MKSSFSDMFAMVFTFLHILRFYIFLQGIAFALKYMNIFMKSSFFDIFAMVFTFLRFLHFFTRNRVCSKSTPRHRFLFL